MALKRVEKVGNVLSREYEILFEVRDCDHVVKILVSIIFIALRICIIRERITIN